MCNTIGSRKHIECHPRLFSVVSITYSDEERKEEERKSLGSISRALFFPFSFLIDHRKSSNAIPSVKNL